MWVKSSLDFGTFEYNNEINIYFNKNNKFYKRTQTFIKQEKTISNTNKLSFISDQTKFLIQYKDGYYHEIIDFLGFFINALEISKELNIKDPFFIFASAPSEGSQIRIFFDKLLQDLKINNYIILDKKIKILEINNCFTLIDLKNPPPVPSPVESMYNLFKNLYVKEKDKIPFKKVYLSRRKVWRNINEKDIYEKGINLNLNSKKSRPRTEIRIFEEEKLENFLINFGVEIIHPEEFFKNNYASQIDYFYKTKTLISVTSSGLINQIWMQPNTNVIEISTSLMFVDNHLFDKDYDVINEYLQNAYKDFSYLKDQSYFAIANKDLQADTIINKIKNNKYVMSILNENY